MTIARGCEVTHRSAVDDSAHMNDHSRLIGDATLGRGVVLSQYATVRDAARIEGLVTVSGFATVGGNVELLRGGTQVVADGIVVDEDDIFLTTPPGGEHLWTVHRCSGGGWKASAGCIRGVDCREPFDLMSTPPQHLQRIRQDHYAWVQDQCRERGM